MEIKQLLILALTLTSLVNFSLCRDNSGLKFAIDTKLLRLIQTVNLNSFAQNRSLVSEAGLKIESTSFPSYKVNVRNLTLTNVKNPEKVDLFTRQEGQSYFLNVVLEKFEVDLETSFDVTVLSVFSDKLERSPIKVVLDKIDSEFYFSNGDVKFSKLDVTIGKIDIKFNSVFYKLIYSLADSLIIKGINKAASNIHHLLEKAVNKFVSEELLFDVGMGIGINATNVDRPELEVFNLPIELLTL
jgi:hypothetical protein